MGCFPCFESPKEEAVKKNPRKGGAEYKESSAAAPSHLRISGKKKIVFLREILSYARGLDLMRFICVFILRNVRLFSFDCFVFGSVEILDIAGNVH